MQPAGLSTHALSYRYDSQSPAVFDALNINIAPRKRCHRRPVRRWQDHADEGTVRAVSPDSGRVEVNGVDIRQLGINNYHKVIACVMQDDKLFSGSIRENICGFADEVDEARMEACARASYLHEVIMRMPMGYETLIGELGKGYPAVRSNGCSLPAIYKKPVILFPTRRPVRWTRKVKRW